MLKKILTAIRTGSAAIAAVSVRTPNGPYKDAATNLIYDLLFCDQLSLFKANHKGDLEPPWRMLFSDNPDFDAITKIANDKNQESRVRVLAFNALRAAMKEVPPKELLGTIIEVRLPGGLDTLAVFTDGNARYINQAGSMAVVEGTPNAFENEIGEVIKTSKPIVAVIGPWEKGRLPAPKKGNIRMTFLVSDGLYFGEGPMALMQQEQMAAPLIGAATSLLMKLVEKTTHNPPGSGGNR